MAFNVTVNKKENETLLEVEGDLDEDGTLPEIGPVQGRLVINLAKLTFINSIGIRSWLTWIKALRTEQGIVLTQCSPPFVRQMSILQNFIPQGVTVADIIVPYYCDQCDQETQKLISTNTDPDTLANEIICEKCKGEMKLEVLKGSYFKFWQNKTG